MIPTISRTKICIENERILNGSPNDEIRRRTGKLTWCILCSHDITLMVDTCNENLRVTIAKTSNQL